MDTSLITQFKEQGYVLFHGVISADEIAAMRNAGAQYFANGKTHMATRDFLSIPRLASLPFHAEIAKRIRAVFGQNYATISQFSMMANLHTPRWHRDSQSQSGSEYLLDPEYLVAKCAVYLQDNDPEWGGGMEIVPFSHRPEYFDYRSSLSRRNPLGKVSRMLQRALVKLRSRQLKPLSLPNKAGDVLLFHANLLHRASQPSADKELGGSRKISLVNPPAEKYKYLIDWEVSPDNQFLLTYLTHQRKRAHNEQGLFRESLEVRYPEDYQPQLLDHIRRLGLRVAHYSEGR